MLLETIRAAPLGHLIRLLTKNKYLLYPEEQPSFNIGIYKNQIPSNIKQAELPSSDTSILEQKNEVDIEGQKNEESLSLSNGVPVTANIDTDIVLVDWNGLDDPENPRNWTRGKKAWVTFLICLYTFVVYCGSAIFVPSFGFIMHKYSVSETVASLGLAIYVVGYALGPMIFSPLSEIPQIGRNPPYIVPFIIFFIISIIISVVDSFAAIIVLRFLQGFFGSPCLASGGASLQDIYSTLEVSYGYILWVGAMYAGPAIGPLLSGYAVVDNWRWSLWEIVFMSAPLIILLTCFLPETSGPAILYQRAKRLRKVTGNDKIMSLAETKTLRVGEIVWEAMIKPTQIAILDPAISFVCIYGALVYAIYYSFFEAFPLVYAGIYGMTIGQIGLVFLSIIVGSVICAIAYAAWLYWFFTPNAIREEPTQEARLVPALYAVWWLPIGLFIFAWTSRADIHWIAPTIGIAIYAGSSFVVFQCIIVYVPLSYPDYVASLFAANDFMRAMAAAGFVMFSRAMYIDLGIGKGVSLLGGLSVMGIVGMYYLYWYGATLRAKSRFAVG